MEIHILGAHNCESRDTRLVSLLIDKIIAIDAGSITSSLPLRAQLGIRAVLLSHRHFDHIRDVATLGMNLYGQETVELYALESALEAVSSHIFSEEVYLDFRRRPSAERPTFKLCPLEPYREVMIEGYAVLPLPVSHSVPTVGYQLTSADGKCFFYSADTRRNSSSLWEAISPQLLIIEVTLPNSFNELAVASGHLTPQMLKEELAGFKRLKGSLPPIITVHMSPHQESEIRRQVAEVSTELGVEITLGYEDMKIAL